MLLVLAFPPFDRAPADDAAPPPPPQPLLMMLLPYSAISSQTSELQTFVPLGSSRLRSKQLFNVYQYEFMHIIGFKLCICGFCDRRGLLTVASRRLGARKGSGAELRASTVSRARQAFVPSPTSKPLLSLKITVLALARQLAEGFSSSSRKLDKER